MSNLKSINEFRRKLMHQLTKNIGNTSNLSKFKNKHPNIKIKKVLICRPNHRLGNLLLITPLVQEVIEAFPECEIDLMVQGGLAPILFENYTNVKTIISLPKRSFKYPIEYLKGIFSLKKKEYDMAINAVKGSSSGKIYVKMASAKFKILEGDQDQIEKLHKDYKHIAKFQVYSFRDYLVQLGFPKNNRPVKSLNLKLSTDEILIGKKELRDLVANDKKTICIFTHATDDKCYSESWWTSFYEKLKSQFETYNIMEILPIENISKINFQAPSYYSKDIRKMAALMANTAIFIGADSGIMHLASASPTKTIGLFSRANQEKYQPYGDGSLAINTNENDIDQCIKIIHEVLG